MTSRNKVNASRISIVPDDDRPLPERIADRITQLIVDDAYRAGSKLPNEYILAERLGVGRSTVREAIKILASQNVLEVQHGSGTFVCERTGLVDDPLGFRFFRAKKKLAIDLCEIRLMLEPQIAAAAAKNATRDQIEALDSLSAEVAELFDSGEDHSEKDIALHAGIAEASGNVVAPRIVGIISTSIPLFITVTRRSLREETIRTHQNVVDAIRRQDPDEAGRAMREHIEHNLHNFEALPEDF